MIANCCILHIEDDENDSILFQRALTNTGFHGQYRRVATPADAMKQLDSSQVRPHVVITDSQLASGTAEDLIAWVRRNADLNHVPVVVLSGALDPQQQRSAFERGATAFFCKSGDLNRIAETILKLPQG